MKYNKTGKHKILSKVPKSSKGDKLVSSKGMGARVFVTTYVVGVILTIFSEPGVQRGRLLAILALATALMLWIAIVILYSSVRLYARGHNKPFSAAVSKEMKKFFA